MLCYIKDRLWVVLREREKKKVKSRLLKRQHQFESSTTILMVILLSMCWMSTQLNLSSSYSLPTTPLTLRPPRDGLNKMKNKEKMSFTFGCCIVASNGNDNHKRIEKKRTSFREKIKNKVQWLYRTDYIVSRWHYYHLSIHPSIGLSVYLSAVSQMSQWSTINARLSTLNYQLSTSIYQHDIAFEMNVKQLCTCSDRCNKSNYITCVCV